jgi:hypothetical protein
MEISTARELAWGCHTATLISESFEECLLDKYRAVARDLYDIFTRIGAWSTEASDQTFVDRLALVREATKVSHSILSTLERTNLTTGEDLINDADGFGARHADNSDTTHTRRSSHSTDRITADKR